MKRTALIYLALAASARAYEPTQTDLQAALYQADKAWGEHADVALIKLENLNKCNGLKDDSAALTRFSDRSITINSGCKWTKPSLFLAVMHEYGHMLAGDATHSPDKKSVMYYKLHLRQKVTEDNRSYVALQAEYRAKRPTILIGASE